MYRYILICLIAVLPLSSLAQTQQPDDIFKTSANYQKNEKWWGFYLYGSPLQPLMAPQIVNIPSDYNADRVPVAVSSTGRYVCGTQAFGAAVNIKDIEFLSGTEKLAVQKGGSTLREAYLIYRHTSYPPDGIIPAKELFTMPVYETENELGFAQGHDEILEYARRILSEGFPPGIIVIGDGWRSMTDPFLVDHHLYPEPKRTVDELHELGFKVMLTVTPYVGAFGKVFGNFVHAGHYISDEHGAPALFDINGGKAMSLDLRDVEQMDIFRRAFEYTRREFPVDGFRFDARATVEYLTSLQEDYIAFLESMYGIGFDGDLCEYLPLSNKLGINDVHNIEYDGWSGDNLSAAINDLHAASLSGRVYSTLISSHRRARPRTDEGVAGRIAVQACMPVMRVEFAPWSTEGEAAGAIRQAFEFRRSIAAYMDNLIEESRQTAEPVIRHMEYQFPNSGFADCSDQYMLGPKYLVAPIAAGESKRLVRLPRGTWTDANGKKFRGPLVMEVSARDGRLIYFEH